MSDDFAAALQVALAKLATRERFEPEIRNSLTAFDESTVDAVIIHLRERRLLSSERATSAWAKRFSGKRAVGAERLREELLKNGASSEEAEAATGALNETETMISLLEAKYRPEPTQRAKAARFLFARGFAEENIESVLSLYFGESPEDHSE